MIEQVVRRYAGNSTIESWQVENEPFLSLTFAGLCPKITPEMLKEKVALVRRLDPGKPVFTAESGELNSWTHALRLTDAAGITVYRKIYNSILDRPETYVYTPELYHFKSDVMRWLTGTQNKPVFVAEFQAEPWGPKGIPEMSIAEQQRYFSIDDLNAALEFNSRTGLDQPTLFWGAEWWYRMKEQGQPEYWQTMRERTGAR
jgi:hypothetical protein